MAFEYNSSKLSDGLAVSFVGDPKFCTEIAVVRFIVPLDEVKSQRYSAVTSMLAETCKHYPQKADIAKRLAYLYGASLNSFSYRMGSYQITGLSVSGIADRYSLDGENISLEYARLLLDCIFEPDINDGKFAEDIFEQKLSELKNKLKNEYNNRHAYAIKRARQAAFEGEASAISVLGTAENAEKITNEDLVEDYHELLENAFISVSFVGRGENKAARELITKRLEELIKGRRTVVKAPESFLSPSPLKDTPKEIREEIEQSQSKLVMFFKSDSSDIYADAAACELFGGAPISRLFMNVREKLSLCYYCSSTVIDCKNTLVVDSGVDSGNEQKAREEILRQLEGLKSGDFTDEEIADVKRSICSGARAVYDSPEELNSWYFERMALGNTDSPDSYCEKINAVTREQMIRSFNSLKLDTVYVLAPKGSKADERHDD